MTLRTRLAALSWAAALALSQLPVAYAQTPGGSVESLEAVQTGPEPTPQEAAGLDCLNRNRAAVQLPPLALRDFREGRAAGMIASPEQLCADALPASASQDVQAGADVSSPSGGTPSEASETSSTLLFLALIAAAAALYFVPTIIAFKRGHRYRWPILAINIAGAWSGVGWIACLIWALWPRQTALLDPLVTDATGLDR